MKKSILVFIDGTISDGRQRYHLLGTPDFYLREHILSDRIVPGSVNSLQQLARRYEIIYIGARPIETITATKEWLTLNGFPPGEVFLGESQDERIKLVRDIKRMHDFIAGIGDRWDDNELHFELGCLSIILQEHKGDWEFVFTRIDQYHRGQKIQENRLRLEGKVEGLARVCPLLLSKYGEKLWDVYLDSVLKMAENSRESRRIEDLQDFRKNHLHPGNLQDAARMFEIWTSSDWEDDPLFGLQEREIVEVSPNRFVHKVTSCYYADLWKAQAKPEIGYQLHCRTDRAWWDRPAWNPNVRFEQPQTLMTGANCCLFIQYLPQKGSK